MTKDKPGMIDVRCCCDPGKLLGYIPHPGGYLGKIRVPCVRKGFYATVEVANYNTGAFTQKAAVKSNDLPIEFYEQIRGWVPATGADMLPTE